MKVNALLSVTALGVLMVGCSTTGRKVDQTQVDTIRIGDSKTDVESRIGAPEQIAHSLAGGETWIYSYSRSRPNAKRFIPLLGTFIGGKNVETQTVTVLFDGNSRVADISTAYGGTAQGTPAPTSTGTHTPATTNTTVIVP